MRWKKGRRSSNIEDRRGGRAASGVKMGGGMMILAFIASLLLGQNPLDVLRMLGANAPSATSGQSQPNKAQSEAADFASVILADTEDTWGKIFSEAGQRYQPPKLVLYSDRVNSACGMSTSATGPFYCPGDYKVYLDLSFLQELQQMGAHGDFAFAYVVAHEVAHHVQNLLGTSSQVRQMQSKSSKSRGNALSVLLELQADCFAGVWANHAHTQRNILEQGDLEEGINAAASVGDDRLLRQAGRSVNPDAFTHGTSKQRMQWFRTGLESGNLRSCDTFGQAGL